MQGYRLVTYLTDNGPRAGMLRETEIIDIAAATGHASDATMLGLLEDWDAAQSRLSQAFESRQAGIALQDAHLLAPVPKPGAIYCAGANYADHVAEMARARGTQPDPDPHTFGLKAWHFIKSTHCVAGPNAEITLPPASKSVDWEAELAVVIGRRAKNVTLDQALDHVAGYTLANDLSARDLGRRNGMPEASPFRHDWIAHKCFDGSCPLGPWITPARFAGDAQARRISLDINGIGKQDSNTADMIYTIAEQIAHLSERLTLHPGDVILTGTPAGVGNGRGEFLKPGDVVTVRVDGYGELTSRIV